MKFTYTPLVNLNNQSSAIANINNNMAAIQTAMEKTLSRDGTSPNAMQSSLDMNGNHILNLPTPTESTDAVRLQDITGPVSIITNNNIIYYNILDYIPVNLHAEIQAYTSTSDVTSYINTAISAVNVTGGVLLFPRGRYYFTGTIGQPNLRNITLLGVGGRDLNYAANSGTVFYYTGSNSKIFDFTEARGCGCENFQVVQTSNSFTGRVFDCNQTNAIGSDLHFKRIQFYKTSTPYTCDAVWYLRNNVGDYFEECHVARAVNAWKGLEDGDTGGIINETNVILLHKCLTIELSGSAIINPFVGWSIISCNFELGYLGAVCGVKCTPNKTITNISFTDSIFADASLPGTWIDLKDVAGFSFIGGTINGLSIPNGITGIKFSGTYLSGVSINGVNFGAIDNGINFNTSLNANGVSVTGNTFLNVTNPIVNINNTDANCLIQGNLPPSANRALTTDQGGTGTTTGTGTGNNVLSDSPTISGFPNFTGTPYLQSGLIVLDGSSNFRAKNGGDISAVIFNTKNSGEGVGFSFQDNTSTKWSLYKDAFHTFYIYDFANGVNSFSISPSSISFGHIDIGYTTAATSTTTGSLRNSGGFGNGGTGYFGGSITSNANTAIPAGGTTGSGLMMSSTSDFGIFFGSGAPTLSAAKGSLYLRSDGSSTSTRMYVNTDGTTGWTAVTTAT